MAIDWTASMTQTYEYYIVDPLTWLNRERITNIVNGTTRITRDISSETLESATFETTEEYTECYIRVYLVVTQNGGTEKVCLGTFLAQSPSKSYNGKHYTYNLEAYSCLLELKDKQPPLGFTVLKDQNIMDNAIELTRTNLRLPIYNSAVEFAKTLYSNYTAEVDENWLSFISSLMSQAGYSYLLDETGAPMFAPSQDIRGLQPVWTYTDDNTESILQADISDNYDLYGIPNVVEVIYSSSNGTYYRSIVRNDSTGPTSIEARGREIHYRETSPAFYGTPTQIMVDDYAKNLLKSLNSVEHTITYSHGYCPVRLGDCVRLNYSRAGINNVKARVISQNIDCKSGCVVNETAVYTTNLWED